MIVTFFQVHEIYKIATQKNIFLTILIATFNFFEGRCIAYETSLSPIPVLCFLFPRQPSLAIAVASGLLKFTNTVSNIWL